MTGARDYQPLMWKIVKGRSPPRVNVAVEVGTRAGNWAAQAAQALGDRLDRLFCVDPWAETKKTSYLWPNIVPNWFKTVEPWLWTKIIPLRGTSIEWAQVFPYRINLLFIDGDHSDVAFEADLNAWLPKMAGGGLVICHEYHLRPLQKVMQRRLNDCGSFIVDFEEGEVGPVFGREGKFVRACWFNVVRK